MGKIILANRGDETKIIEEEKKEWINNVLVFLGVSNEHLASIDCVNILKTLNIEVIDNRKDESIEIKKDSRMVAKWNFPKLVIKKDNKDYYYEIHINEEWGLPYKMKMRKG